MSLPPPPLATESSPHLVASRLGVSDLPGPDLVAFALTPDPDPSPFFHSGQRLLAYAAIPTQGPAVWGSLCPDGSGNVCIGGQVFDQNFVPRNKANVNPPVLQPAARASWSDEKPTAVEHERTFGREGGIVVMTATIGPLSCPVSVCKRSSARLQYHRTMARTNQAAGPRIWGPNVPQFSFLSPSGPAATQVQRRLYGQPPINLPVNSLWSISAGTWLDAHESSGVP